jgi:hypothetical protein
MRCAAPASRAECDYAGGQQQHHPAPEKEPGGIDQVGVNKLNVHSLASRGNTDSADSAVLQLRFTGQVFVLLHNLTDSIEAAERGEMYIRKRFLYLRHPTFDGPLDSNRHLSGDGVYDICSHG